MMKETPPPPFPLHMGQLKKTTILKGKQRPCPKLETGGGGATRLHVEALKHAGELWPPCRSEPVKDGNLRTNLETLIMTLQVEQKFV